MARGPQFNNESMAQTSQSVTKLNSRKIHAIKTPQLRLDLNAHYIPVRGKDPGRTAHFWLLKTRRTSHVIHPRWRQYYRSSVFGEGRGREQPAHRKQTALEIYGRLSCSRDAPRPSQQHQAVSHFTQTAREKALCPHRCECPEIL